MLARTDIANGLTGSWKLLKGEPDGMRSFDQTLNGFCKSFWVLGLIGVPVLIGVLLERKLLMMQKGIDPSDFPEVLFFISQIGAYIATWFGFPLILAAIARWIGLDRHFVPFIVARNWTSIIGIAPYFVASVLFLFELITVRTFGMLSLLSLGFNLFYGFRVARIAAAAPISVAIGLVVLDLLVTLFFAVLGDRMVNL
jgi:hypothetical protein